MTLVLLVVVTEVATALFNRKSVTFAFVTVSENVIVSCEKFVTVLSGAGDTAKTVGGIRSATAAASSGFWKKSTSFELTLKPCTAMTFVPRRKALVKAAMFAGCPKKTVALALVLYGVKPAGTLARRTSRPLTQVM